MAQTGVSLQCNPSSFRKEKFHKFIWPKLFYYLIQAMLGKTAVNYNKCHIFLNIFMWIICKREVFVVKVIATSFFFLFCRSESRL